MKSAKKIIEFIYHVLHVSSTDSTNYMYLFDICTHSLNELYETKRMRSKRRFRKFLMYNGSKLKGKIPRAEQKKDGGKSQ